MIYKFNIGNNKIFEADNFYYIKAPKSERYVRIDRDNNLLDYIKEFIKNYGSLHYVSERYPFRFSKGFNGEHLYISKLIYCYYNNIDLDERKNLHIAFIDGDQYNCSVSNMIDTKKNSRHITTFHDDSFIYLIYKRKNVNIKYITDYTPSLFSLITNPCFYWTIRDFNKSKSGNSDYRLEADLYYNNKRCQASNKISLARVVYGYYYFGLRDTNIQCVVEKMNDELNRRNLFIDHLISDGTNNTIANLSAIDRGLNSSKQFIDKKIIPPYYLTMACKNGIYKAILNVFVRGMTGTSNIVTSDNMDEFLDKMKELLNIHPLHHYQSPRQWRKDSGAERYVMQDNYKIQKILYDNFDDKDVNIKIGRYIKSEIFRSDKADNNGLLSNQ